MKLYIKQAVFTLGESFTVKDENGFDVFYVKGSFLSIPKSFKIYDVNQNQVASIDRHLITFLGGYDIKTNNESVTLLRQMALFTQAYKIKGIDWKLRGDFLNFNYQVVSGNRLIMQLKKHWFTWGDSYELNIVDDNDAILALCIAICVDYEILRDSSN